MLKHVTCSIEVLIHIKIKVVLEKGLCDMEGVCSYKCSSSSGIIRREQLYPVRSLGLHNHNCTLYTGRTLIKEVIICNSVWNKFIFQFQEPTTV
jgi:hypothetical protein